MMGYKYFLIVVNDKSRLTWLFLMRLKSEASPIIKSFVSLVKTQLNTSIKCIISNNGCEFILTEFYKQHGIIHQTSCVGSPQKNEIIERKHQHILGITRAILFQSNLT